LGHPVELGNFRMARLRLDSQKIRLHTIPTTTEVKHANQTHRRQLDVATSQQNFFTFQLNDHANSCSMIVVYWYELKPSFGCDIRTFI